MHIIEPIKILLTNNCNKEILNNFLKNFSKFFYFAILRSLKFASNLKSSKFLV